MLAALDAELERAGTLLLFADLRDSPRMPAESREKIARWMRRHQTLRQRQSFFGASESKVMRLVRPATP